jgi:FlaA1/EpsC-like NDP-sugar epimerase
MGLRSMNRFNTALARLRHGMTVFAHDVLVIPMAWLGAYWLRFNLDVIPPAFWRSALGALPIVVVLQVAVYWGFGLYRGVWRFASMPDLLRVIKVAVAGLLLSSFCLFFVNRLDAIPRSVPLLYGLLLIMFLGGSRFVFRWFKDYGYFLKGKRVLIVGAGEAGESLVRDLLRGHHDFQVVAFVDDKARNLGKEIQGVRVVGPLDDIPKVVRRYAVELVIIALPSVKAEIIRRIVRLCEEVAVDYRTLPSVNDLTQGRVLVDALRQVSLEDLLGRDPVSLDWEKISAGIGGKSVLVTGGAGSIGSELCRQIASLKPAVLVVVDQNEHQLYELRLAMTAAFPELNLALFLEDITDRVALRRVFRDHAIDIVFHAAAYKHVPMLEPQIRVAIRNNVLGTQVLAEEAVAAGVKKFVMISTDKAVHPANIMGASKRIAEIFCQNFNAHSSTAFITVRFGNVLGSAGSVVPLFKRQIEQGGPVTVTHPEVTRYFMTIPEATQLILQATIMGQGGEIFVLDMGESIKIVDLAAQMIKLAGHVPGEGIDIVFTGLRPGEKMFEELFHEREALTETTHPKILQAQHRSENWNELLMKLIALQQLVDEGSEFGMASLLLELVPEYHQEAKMLS